MMILPPGAVAIGMAAGVLSTLGFEFIQGFLDDKIGVHDTCGVNNLHGMPGLLSGICSVIVAAFATNEMYGGADRVFTDFESGTNQAMKQMGALVMTFVVSI